jgi:hypothetical protein
MTKLQHTFDDVLQTCEGSMTRCSSNYRGHVCGFWRSAEHSMDSEMRVIYLRRAVLRHFQTLNYLGASYGLLCRVPLLF